MFLDDNSFVPYEALKYVTGECNYGGRVTDDKDRILLNTIMESVYGNATVESDHFSFRSGPREPTPTDLHPHPRTHTLEPTP